MARMFPRTLLVEDVKSEAERLLFDVLRDGLDDGWTVFHSASLIVRDPGKGAQDDESDFVLCHPDQGIVSLEVKGGGLECRHGEWFRLQKGERERMKDPFTQALDHRYALERKLREIDGWRHARLLVVHALAFPDITVHRLVLGADAPPELIVDREGVRDIAASIQRVLAYHRGAQDPRKAPGEDGVELVRELLVPDVRIEVPLATRFAAEERELVALTDEQTTLLRNLRRTPRMAVTGCAGSGKTMLAIERGRELAAAGRRVLFVCFNKALAQQLKRQRPDGMDVFTFHALCTHWAHKQTIPLPKYDGVPPPHFWRTELPEAFGEAIDAAGPQYDDVLVDEAQDLHADWLEMLTWTLREPASLWLFMDDNQRVYDADLRVPADFLRYDLSVNCRNTQAIHREVMKLYEGEIVPDVRGPEGRDIELITSADQPATVAAVVDRAQREWDVRPKDIVVLSAHGREKSGVHAAGRYCDTRDKGVYFSSIRGFKGLESPVVVLCELEDLDASTRDQQLYVGLSRARNHCVVVAPAAR